MTGARVDIRGLQVHYPVRKGLLRRNAGFVRAVDGVDIRIAPATTFGLVGESGCGKSTLARAILKLQPAQSGEIAYRTQNGDCVDLLTLSPAALRPLRREIQIVFQDPYSALNPRLRIGDILDENLRAMEHLSRAQRRARIEETLALVGMPATAMRRYPHQLSGGQRQRIAIARALVSRPSFIVLDEPVSALDVSVRAQVINLLQELQEKLGLTYLFVSHDLSVVRYVCDRVSVMYLGRIVETSASEDLFAEALHPYTQMLLAAAPKPVPGRARARVMLEGDPPNPMDIPPGCAFHTRCPRATDICRQTIPQMRQLRDDHWAACHHAA